MEILPNAKVALIFAAYLLLMSLLTIAFESVALLFLSYISVVIVLIFHGFLLVPYLKTKNSYRDAEWKSGMKWLNVCHVIYILAIILLAVGTKLILR
jgi:uncharacterized membrane protein